ncbi:unnamed protein product [Pleuronectes platessa]|uniref:Uncharacterized protein n=1 Tax=Pleuronectes platessa TaxID=8262 RepID=A0A9N7Y2V5_PLEPL|nr:unnamed protein product [Pleuronectes platessa]
MEFKKGGGEKIFAFSTNYLTVRPSAVLQSMYHESGDQSLQHYESLESTGYQELKDESALFYTPLLVPNYQTGTRYIIFTSKEKKRRLRMRKEKKRKMNVSLCVDSNIPFEGEGEDKKDKELVPVYLQYMILQSKEKEKMKKES